MPNRAEALATIARGHRDVHALLADVDTDELDLPATIGGGDWSAKDLIGHLTTWEEIALVTIDEWLAKERPVIEDVFSRDGVDQLNADEVARKSAGKIGELLARFDEVHRQLAEALAAIDDDEWNQAAPYDASEPDTTLGSLIGVILGSDGKPFDHIFAHEDDLSVFVDARR